MLGTISYDDGLLLEPIRNDSVWENSNRVCDKNNSAHEGQWNCLHPAFATIVPKKLTTSCTLPMTMPNSSRGAGLTISASLF
jgi:hypothetical protein